MATVVLTVTKSLERVLVSEVLSVGGVAKLLNVRPTQVSQLFTERRLSDEHCPVVAGRRLVPPDYVQIIAMELRRKGIDVDDVGVSDA